MTKNLAKDYQIRWLALIWDSTSIHTDLLAPKNFDALDTSPEEINNMMGEFADVFVIPEKSIL